MNIAHAQLWGVRSSVRGTHTSQGARGRCSHRQPDYRSEPPLTGIRNSIRAELLDVDMDQLVGPSALIPPRRPRAPRLAVQRRPRPRCEARQLVHPGPRAVSGVQRRGARCSATRESSGQPARVLKAHQPIGVACETTMVGAAIRARAAGSSPARGGSQLLRGQWPRGGSLDALRDELFEHGRVLLSESGSCRGRPELAEVVGNGLARPDGAHELPGELRSRERSLFVAPGPGSRLARARELSLALGWRVRRRSFRPSTARG